MHIIGLCLMLVASAAVSAQTLHLPFGTTKDQLGVYVDGDYLRGPFAAAAGADGTLWVADSYKARVAQFSSSGQYLGELPLEAVSPRMTVFARRSNGFVTLGDQTIAVWKNDGTSVVQIPLGLALPNAVWVSERKVIAEFSQNGSSFSQAWDDTGATTRSSLRRGATETAVVQDGRPWFPRWAEQKALFRWSAPVEDEAALAGWNAQGASVWVRRSGDRAKAWWVQADGSMSGRSAEFSDVRSQGTAVTVSADLSLVVSRWRTDALEIEILKSPRKE